MQAESYAACVEVCRNAGKSVDSMLKAVAANKGPTGGSEAAACVAAPVAAEATESR